MFLLAFGYDHEHLHAAYGLGAAFGEYVCELIGGTGAPHCPEGVCELAFAVCEEWLYEGLEPQTAGFAQSL